MIDLNRRVRHAMTEAAAQGVDARSSGALGFAAFFRFTAEHPALYRIIRQAEFVSPEMLQLHYERLTSGYIAGLQARRWRRARSSRATPRCSPGR